MLFLIVKISITNIHSEFIIIQNSVILKSLNPSSPKPKIRRITLISVKIQIKIFKIFLIFIFYNLNLNKYI